ncbi:MAG: hypothetical protein QM776_04160 [Rhodocyclaceae bacterium]
MLETCALYELAFAVFHLCFWRLFRWTENLQRIDFINRNIMQILNIRLTYVFVMVALLLGVAAVKGEQGWLLQALLGGMALFWLMRTAEQFWFFGRRNHMSNAMAIVFAAGAALHGWAFIQVRQTT